MENKSQITFNWDKILHVIGELNSNHFEAQFAWTKYFSTIENFSKSSPSNILFPEPIWREILKLLDANSLLSLSQTCKKLRFFASGTIP